jgi:hypothetical protein
MTIFQTTSSVKVEIIPALEEQEPILANLLELYAHDFSEFIDLNLGADGRYAPSCYEGNLLTMQL